MCVAMPSRVLAVDAGAATVEAEGRQRRASTLRREADPRRRRQKAYALLARNGFAPDVCHEVAATVAEDVTE